MSCHRHVCGDHSSFSFLYFPVCINKRHALDRLVASKAELVETQKKGKGGCFQRGWLPSTLTLPPPLPLLVGRYCFAHPALLALGFLLLVTANSCRLRNVLVACPESPRPRDLICCLPQSQRCLCPSMF